MEVDPQADNCAINLKNFGGRLCEILFAMQQQNTLCDTVIKTKDGSIMVHKLIVIPSSPTWLKQILSAKNVSSQYLNVLDLSEYGIFEVQVLVKLMYTGNACITKRNAKQLLKLCEMFNMEEARSDIENFVRTTEHFQSNVNELGCLINDSDKDSGSTTLNTDITYTNIINDKGNVSGEKVLNNDKTYSKVKIEVQNTTEHLVPNNLHSVNRSDENFQNMDQDNQFLSGACIKTEPVDMDIESIVCVDVQKGDICVKRKPVDRDGESVDVQKGDISPKCIKPETDLSCDNRESKETEISQPYPCYIVKNVTSENFSQEKTSTKNVTVADSQHGRLKQLDASDIMVAPTYSGLNQYEINTDLFTNEKDSESSDCPLKDYSTNPSLTHAEELTFQVQKVVRCVSPCVDTPDHTIETNSQLTDVSIGGLKTYKSFQNEFEHPTTLPLLKELGIGKSVKVLPTQSASDSSNLTVSSFLLVGKPNDCMSCEFCCFKSNVEHLMVNHTFSEHKVLFKPDKYPLVRCGIEGCVFEHQCKRKFREHAKNEHNSSVTSICYICKKELKNTDRLFYHIKNGHKVGLETKEYKCEHCSYVTYGEIYFVEHMHFSHKTLYKPDKYPLQDCPVKNCNYKTPSPRLMNGHTAGSHFVLINCKICNLKFTKKEFKTHMKMKHPVKPSLNPDLATYHKIM